MDLSQITSIFSSGNITSLVFKVLAVLFSFFYVLYAFIIARQVKIMDQTLEDRFNPFILLVCSLQVAAALILLILAVFLI